ncbi:hypothetical protein [Arthrobacter sp. ES3-54]|uniref:hypothetical protein n=1 Tax=Arthrobacter sp. ES3-54 TaxID=1502991 RepID=UPI002406B598|nr:hypothetical protein [Arthrobacter sp. ES3-54]MDF9750286.1 proteasome assembly chaperone (PAC2) family protein [Arthrobacter sp. ES3-54]
MSKNAIHGTPGELLLLRTRAYFDPQTGEVVHLHRLLAPAGMSVDTKRIEEETSAFEEMLARSHDQVLKSVEVSAEDLQRMDASTTVRVDPNSGELAFERAESGE